MTISAFDQLKLIADESRWRILQLLRQSDYLVMEVVQQTGLAQNLVSYHLNSLRQAGLVQVHRSDADARATYYGVNLTGLMALYQELGIELSAVGTPPLAGIPAATVLILCRGNSARSQMAEGWLRTLSGGRMIVRSAGTHPTTLHPFATAVMAEVGIDIGYQRSKHLDEFATLRPTAVITVCDIAREECAVWLPTATQLHWSISDPVPVEDREARLQAFRDVRDTLRLRIEGFVALLGSGKLGTDPGSAPSHEQAL